MKHLILGGARSGKSRYSEKSARDFAFKNNLQLVYVATATAGDKEMTLRIQQHQNRRGPEWQLIEENLQLANVIEKYNDPGFCVLIDCLTLWLSNSLCAEDSNFKDNHINDKDTWPSLRNNFIHSLEASTAAIFLVSNEVGSGIVPMGELSRKFVDESGWLHQELAEICDQVTLVVAGLPQTLKTQKLKNSE